jgi:hypothetical protein
MDAACIFVVDAARDYLHVTLRGFFDRASVERFVAERAEAFAQLRCARNQHVTLIDIRDVSIQSQESVAIFQTAIDDPRMASRRLAFVVAKSLARMQARRIAEHRSARFFESHDEAEAWLFEQDVSGS